MPTINVAIAGSGYSAKVFHAPFLNNDPRFCVKKVFERSTNHSAQFLPQAEIVRSFDALITEEIDLVIITTPNQTHFDMAKKALLAGKHVLVEKPLVATACQAAELAALAEQQGVKLSVYQNRRWDNAIATAKSVIEQNLLGKLVDCEIRIERYTQTKNAKAWKEAGDAGTGLVYDLGVHLIDQAVYLFGKPQAVFADIRYQHAGALVDDNFTLHLYYDNGLKVAVSAGKYMREPARYFALHGTLGSYVKEKVDNQEGLLAQGIQPMGDWNAEDCADWGILHTEIDGQAVRKPLENAKVSYQILYDNLYAAITENAPLLVTATQAAQVLKIIETAFESAKCVCKLPVE